MVIPEPAPPGTIKKHINRGDPVEVIIFARNLSAAGRNLESAAIYLDAAKRFQSVEKRFENDCRKAAVREYWFAGEYGSAHKLLDEIEKNQDVYSRARESENLRRLRSLLRKSEAVKAAPVD